jgi:hypothetical protein
MRCIRRLGLFVGIVASFDSAPLRADVPEFTPKITDVTVFKDGHALVMSRGEADLEDGWCRTREVPVPVLGAFWTFVTERGAEVDFVKAGFAKAEETRPCLSFEEIIQANVGKRVVMVEQPKDADADSHEGILLGILRHEAEREVEATRTTPSGRDRYGRYYGTGQIRETEEKTTESLASFVMLQKDSGVQLIKRENIRSICLADDSPATAHTETKEVREISLRVLRRGRPADKKAEVGMIYLQKGVRWIPDYRIRLLANGQAEVSLQGTIIHDLADMENIDLHLVVGVPSFIMKESLSPMALREIGLRLSSYFQPPSPRRRDQEYNYFYNAIMTQVSWANAGDESVGGGGPEIPSEGQQEDLFLYHKSGITLKKGERAVVKLLEVTVPYEDIYTWEIPPVPPREMWPNVNQDQQRELQRALSAARVMHEIRLTNTGSVPWTTGPATIFKEGTPLGQQLLAYTSVKNKVDVPITVATDLNTKKEEEELSRKLRALIVNGTEYTKATLHGTLTVTNFKDRDVRIVITRKLLGTATGATRDGKITLSNSMENASILWEGYVWYWWSWPWWVYRVNPISQIEWEADIPAGESARFEYDWHYHFH